MHWLTLEDLVLAMVHRLDWSESEALERAMVVMESFAHHAEVIDNRLTPEDRQVFYALQMEGLLTVRSEVTEIHHGQHWRTLSWVMRADRVQEAARDALVARRDRERACRSGASVYDAVPDDVWVRHAACPP